MPDIDKISSLLGALNEQEVYDAIGEIISAQPTGETVLDTILACQKGMEIVGEEFEKGNYFIGELMYAAQIMDEAIGRLKPLLGTAGEGAESGIVVLGSVAGDIHDIGKSIFRSLLEASGFQVVDIGIDQQPEAFVSAIEKHRPHIVGLSGVLTLSIESMRKTVALIEEAGYRSDLKIIIGGSAASEEACFHSGADYWTKNAALGVKKCKEYRSEQQ
ncbi:MAG: cobalamin-dependent protein [Clostridiales Family XIII bacterium]|jgi:methanogenic corrinoid protein MtbC1|nr:cobalamin-dependent protein [Clostridiales Family XIII bacterium]